CAFGGVNFLAFEIGDQAGWEVDHLVDPAPDAARGEGARLAAYAWVRRTNPAGLRAGVPLIDRVVVLHAWISAAPGREGNLFPEIARLDRLGDLAAGAVDQIPVAIFFHGFEEFIGDENGVIRILPADGVVGFAIEIVIEL